MNEATTPPTSSSAPTKISPSSSTTTTTTRRRRKKNANPKQPVREEDRILLNYFDKIDFEAESRFLREKEEEDFRIGVIDTLPPLYKASDGWQSFFLFRLPIAAAMIGLAYSVLLRNLDTDEAVTISEIYFFGLSCFLAFAVVTL